MSKCALTVLHSWAPARPECWDLVQLQIWQDRLIWGEKNVLSNVYTRCVPILITDTHRKYKSRDNAVICLSEHTCTHRNCHTQKKDSALLMWHLFVSWGRRWDYLCLHGCVCAHNSEYGRKFITALRLSVRPPGTEHLTGASPACWELSLRGNTPSMKAAHP